MQFPAITTARARSLRPYLGLVALAAFSLALGLGLELRRHLDFAYRPGSEIVGWIRVNEYPKQQEFFYFLLALIGPPVVMTLCWLAWIAYGTVAARRTCQPAERCLRQGAVALLPLLLIWPDVPRLDKGWATSLGLPIGLTLVALLGSYWWGARQRPAHRPPEAAPHCAQPTAPSPRRPALRSRTRLLTAVEYLALPAVVYLFAYSGNIHGRIDLFHEGERLAPLNALLRGGIPFRDVYLQHGLFQDAYLARLAAALFGPTLEGLRSMQRILEPLGCVALYLLGLQVFRSGAVTALLLALLASGAHIGVSGRHTLGLISIAFAASYLTRRPGNVENAGKSRCADRGRCGGWRTLVAGVTTSASFWYSTEVGLYTLAAIGGFLLLHGLGACGGSLRRGLSPLLGYGSGVLLGLSSVGAYFALHGALDDAIANTYIQCAYQLDIWGRAFPPLADILEPLADPGIAAGWRPFVLGEGFRWYLPVFVIMIAGGYLTYRWFCGDLWRSEACAKLLLLTLAAAVFFRTALGRSDGLHIGFGVTSAWLLLLFFLERGMGRLLDALRAAGVAWRLRLARAVAHAWILVPALGMLWFARAVHFPGPDRSGERRPGSNSLLAGRLFEPAARPTTLERAGGIDIPVEQEQQIREVVAYIRQQTATDEAIFDFANQGAFYFFADRPSATRFTAAVYASAPDLQQEVIEALERQQTRVVLFKTGSYADRFDGVPNETRLPMIARYLAEHYEPAAQIRGVELLKRRQ